MDVRNSLKFGLSSGNVYTQCNLDSHKKNEHRRKKKELAKSVDMIDQGAGGNRESDPRSKPP